MTRERTRASVARRCLGAHSPASLDEPSDFFVQRLGAPSHGAHTHSSALSWCTSSAKVWKRTPSIDRARISAGADRALVNTSAFCSDVLQRRMLMSKPGCDMSCKKPMLARCVRIKCFNFLEYPRFTAASA